MPRRAKAEFEITAIDRATRTLNNIERGLGSFGRAGQAAGALVATALGGQAVLNAVRLADEYTRLNNRVDFLVDGAEAADNAYTSLLGTVSDVGGELEVAISQFQGFDRVRDNLNLTDQQVLALTDNLFKLGAIGQTSTEAQARALFQLTQFFDEGVLRAEEYNSLVDQAPEIVALLRKELVPAGKSMRELVNQGQIFAGDVARVILDNTESIDERFQRIPTNLERSFNTLETSIGAALSTLDKASGFSSNLAQDFERLAKGIRFATGNLSELEQVEVQIEKAQARLAAQTELLEEQYRLAAGDGVDAFINSLLGVEPQVDRMEGVVARLKTEIDELLARQKELQGAGDNSNVGDGGSADEEALFQERLLRLQGFNSEAEKKQADRLAKELAAELSGQRRILEEREALELGYASARERALADLENKFRNASLARAQADREAAFQLELAQIAGFNTIKAQEEADRQETLFQAKLDARVVQFEEELAQALGFATREEFEVHQLELELEELRHQEKLARQEERFEEELAIALGYESRKHQELEEQERSHQLQLQIARANGNKLAEKAAKKLQDIELLYAKNKTLGTLAYAQALTEGLAGNSEKAFKVLQAAKLAEAIVNTATGVTRALSSYDFVGAALIAAMGAAQIQTIRAQSFQGGSGGGGGSFGGVSSAGPAQEYNNPIRDIPVFEDEDRNVVEVSLVLGGGDELTEVLASNMTARTRDGDEVTITRGSRQELELAGGI